MAASNRDEPCNLQAHFFFSCFRTIWPDRPVAAGLRLRTEQYAEGYGKSSKGEYLFVLGHARGSNGEVQRQLIIARGLGFGTPDSLLTAESLSNEVGRMLVVMMNRLKR